MNGQSVSLSQGILPASRRGIVFIENIYQTLNLAPQVPGNIRGPTEPGLKLMIGYKQFAPLEQKALN